MYYPNIYSSHVTNVTLKKNGREVKVKKTERVEPDAGKLPALETGGQRTRRNMRNRKRVRSGRASMKRKVKQGW